MRLTLRTLLAYLDGILKPEDHEELAKQIEQSDNAKELVHRTGDTTRRIRLGAPPVDSPTHDANAVAAYLDNTMPPEEVMEFERRCLESDPELAEVASSHHILTMVLGQRAEIDPDLKHVMYALPAQQQSKADAPAQPHASASVVVQAPDYLRADQRSFARRIAPAIATLLLLAGAAWVFAPGGWYDRQRNVEQVAKNKAENLAPPTSPAENPVESTVPDEDLPDEGLPATEQELPSDAQSATVETPTVDAPAAKPPAADAEKPAGTAVSDEPLEKSPAEPPVVTNPEPAETRPVETGPAEASSTGETPAPIDLPTTLPNDLPPAAEGSGETAPEEPALAETDVETSPPVEPVVEPVVVGMVTAPRQVLLRYNGELSGWERPPRNEGELPNVRTGDRLLSLPSYRPRFKVRNADISPSGATLVELLPSTRSPDSAVVHLMYGRLVIANTGVDEAEVELRVGSVSGVAALRRGALVAIEAERCFQPGLDPATESPPLKATYYAPRGGLRWAAPDGDFEVDDRSVWRQAGGTLGPVTPDAVDIDWLDDEPVSTLERRAAVEIERNLSRGGSVWPQLAALYDTRRVEEQAQVAISSMHVGHYDPFVKALSDLEQKSFWSQEIEAIRSTMSRSPELAQAVRDALVDGYGEDYAADLYRMLCGFTAEQVGIEPDQQRQGALRQLIDWLESDQVAYRVLANHNLEQITNRRVFNPIASPDRRRRTIAVFRARLEDGELIRTDR